MMLGLGLGTRPADFKAVLQRPRGLLLSCLSMLGVLPLFGFAIADIFQLQPDLAVGLVLVATCPGGIMSNYFSKLLFADLALSISMTTVISLGYIFTVPLWVALALSRYYGEVQAIDLPYSGFILRLGTFIFLPVVSGIVVAARFPRLAATLRGYLTHCSAIGLVSLYLYLLWLQRATLGEALQSSAVPVLILFLASVLSAYLVARAARLATPQLLAVVVEHASRQEATAIYIATVLLGSTRMSLPLLLNTACGVVVIILLALSARLARLRVATAHDNRG